MADDKVTWPELLTEYGIEKMLVQNLFGSLDGNQTTREKDKSTRLSFRTEITLSDVMSERKKGFVLWFDADELAAAMERCKGRRSLGERGDADG